MKKSILFSLIVAMLFACAGCNFFTTPSKETLPEAASKETSPQANDDPTAVFATLPESFSFLSGVGAWSTEVSIYADGTFSGHFHDTNMGEDDDGNSITERNQCFFNGKFTNVKKIDDYTYLMEIETLNTEGTVGERKLEEDALYITTEPYGFDNAGEFFLYLPGKSVSELPQEFLIWVYSPAAMGENVEILPLYGLYNVGGQQGFFAYGE